MNEKEMLEHTESFLAAWNTQDVETVVAGYTKDVVYSDPNTRGAVEGADALRRYLAKLFSAWEMTWALREAHLHDDAKSCSVLWHATFRKAGGEKMVEADGMDLVVVENGKIKRNEVFFDRAIFASLMLYVKVLRQLL